MLTGTVPIQGLVGCPCKGCIRSDDLVCNLEQHLLCGLGFSSVGITYHYLQRAQVHILAHAYGWVEVMAFCALDYIWCDSC